MDSRAPNVYKKVSLKTPRYNQQLDGDIEFTQTRITHRLSPTTDETSTFEEEIEETESDAQKVDKKYKRFRLLEWIQKLRSIFGTHFLILVAVVYWAQGFKSFSSLAINYMFKDEFKLDPSESQAITTFMYIPWGIKPLYGILSDSLPILGYRRRPYLLIFGCIACWAYIMLSIPRTCSSAISATFFLFLTNMSTAFNDVVIDARIVEVSRLDPTSGANDLQSLSWIMMSVGGAMGALLSGPATEELGARIVFLFAALGPLLVIVLTVKMPEERVAPQVGGCLRQARHHTVQLINAIRYSKVWRSALWIFLSGASAPSFTQLTFYYVTDVLSFSAKFLGMINAVGYIFLIGGTAFYNAFFTKVSFRKMFFWSQVALAVVSSLDLILVTRTNLTLGISDKVFVLGDEIISDVVGRIKTMPVLVLCAKLCPKGVEGTLFALLMSISNFSGSVSSFLGAFLCHILGISRGHYSLIWIAIAVRSICKLLPIFCLFLIPEMERHDMNDSCILKDEEDDECERCLTEEVDEKEIA